MSINPDYQVRRQYHEMRHAQVKRIMDVIHGAVGYRKSTAIISECDYSLLMEALADFEKKVTEQSLHHTRFELLALYRAL